MFRKILPLILIIALLSTGCTVSPTIIPAATPTQPGITAEWVVKMTQSGGIMGLMRSVVVSSKGNYTVTDHRTKKEVTGRLGQIELVNLNESITKAKLPSPEKPTIGICTDCFIYDIEIINNSEVFTIQMNDISLPDSGMEDLITFLRDLTNMALK